MPMTFNWTEILKSGIDGLIFKYTGDESKSARLAEFLTAKYSEKHRAYHNLNHVRSLLQTAGNFRAKITDYDSIIFAIWFHDAIYDPQGQTNELDSAALAVEKLTVLNYPQERTAKVEKMILATQKHDASSLDADGQLFLDLDLEILGADAEVYKQYAGAIREEYSFVPETLYREKRREILQRFLQREFIYYTDEMRETREKAARRNIANEIKELS